MQRIYGINKTVYLNTILLINKKRLAYRLDVCVDAVLEVLKEDCMFKIIPCGGEPLIILSSRLREAYEMLKMYTGDEALGHLLGYEYPTNNLLEMNGNVGLHYYAIKDNEKIIIYSSRIPKDYDCVTTVRKIKEFSEVLTDYRITAEVIEIVMLDDGTCNTKVIRVIIL